MNKLSYISNKYKENDIEGEDRRGKFKIKRAGRKFK